MPIGSFAQGNLTGNFARKVADIKGLDRPDAGISCQQAIPVLFDPAPQGGYEAHSGYDHSSHDYSLIDNNRNTVSEMADRLQRPAQATIRPLRALAFNEGDLEAQVRVKDVFDAKWLLNPAKVVPLITTRARREAA